MMQGRSQLALKRIEPTSYVFSKQSLLGKGAFGEVYLGFDQKNKVPLAIKTISNQRISKVSSNQQPLKQKIAGELGNMQLCRSQRLVQLISPHFSSKNIYVVCQYCNGGSLKDYLSKKGQLSEFETLNFFKDILQGLKCLHEKKVVHRDMKPANLLLHNRRIKIGDLGFSKCISVHEQILTSAVGTPLYMSPQILSNSTYTQKTDIWSLGILLYQMLVGQAPWRVNTLQQIKQKVRHKPQFPRNCIISPNTKSLIMSMLQMQEKNRIGWQQLFQFHLLPASEMQQQPSNILAKTKQLNDYFIFSLAIESQFHIIYMLQKYNKKYVNFQQGCENGKQFFHRIQQLQKQKKNIDPLINLFVQGRNQYTFLIRLFMECYDCCEELDSIYVYTSMLMIIKYSIAKCQTMISKQILSTTTVSVEIIQMFQRSSYWTNFKQLLILDLELLRIYLKIYFSEIFMHKVEAYGKKNIYIVQQINKQLKPFYNDSSISIKFTEFAMKNQCRHLFNAFKDTQNIQNNWLMIPRLIYQYQKANKTHIFVNLGEKSSMNKKMEAWEQEQRWKGKLKELKKYDVESLAVFVNRQMQWNSIKKLQMGFE